MLSDVMFMHVDRRTKLEKMMTRKQPAAKRTTIILEREERAFIDALIVEGKVTGIKSLISKMLDIYRNMTIYDWRFPGEYYWGIR